MERGKIRTFQGVRLLSSASVAVVTVLSILFSSVLGKDSLNWQIALAILALAIGIPHGAVDHLITLPRTKPLKMAIFVSIYIAVALLAIWAILQWNVWGFIAVVVMSSIHFGIGDSAFIAELSGLEGRRRSKVTTWAYAIAAGFTPVVIPLISKRSTEALEQVNPVLIDWHQGFDSEILVAMSLVVTISIFLIAKDRALRDLVDLLLLVGLVSFAPPLVAFATYFGTWHAMRHTARLTSLLPKSQLQHSEGKSLAAFVSAVIPGLPALVGTFIFIFVLGAFARESIDDRFLWLTLVTIWALTVPHMLVTARLDRVALKS